MNIKKNKSSADESNFDRKNHWERVYSDKTSTEVSWYQQHPEYSLDLIKASGINKAAHVIDIGGGASTLVDCLLDAGYQNLSVLDIAHSAIEQAKHRLGKRASEVEWLECDITKFSPDNSFDLWHDRAVFHFLGDEKDRLSYLQVLSQAVSPGGHVIIATFNLDGPEKCSGLDVVRYSPETMSAVLGENFQLLEVTTEEHKTPGNILQKFVYCRFKRV